MNRTATEVVGLEKEILGMWVFVFFFWNYGGLTGDFRVYSNGMCGVCDPCGLGLCACLMWIKRGRPQFAEHRESVGKNSAGGAPHTYDI